MSVDVTCRHICVPQLASQHSVPDRWPCLASALLFSPSRPLLPAPSSPCESTPPTVQMAAAGVSTPATWSFRVSSSAPPPWRGRRGRHQVERGVGGFGPGTPGAESRSHGGGRSRPARAQTRDWGLKRTWPVAGLGPGEVVPAHGSRARTGTDSWVGVSLRVRLGPPRPPTPPRVQFGRGARARARASTRDLRPRAQRPGSTPEAASGVSIPDVRSFGVSATRPRAAAPPLPLPAAGRSRAATAAFKLAGLEPARRCRTQGTRDSDGYRTRMLHAGDPGPDPALGPGAPSAGAGPGLRH